MTKISDGVSDNAKGGTELMGDRLFGTIPTELLDQFQIWFSRFRLDQRDPTKRQIFYAHDLPGDPESEFLREGGWQIFDKLVFVSNWQMQAYCAYYQIPYGRCIVLQNAIEPIENISKKTGKIKIGYWSTPHRGLSILIPVFEFLSTKYPEIELDVFSSFALYGWKERDAQYEVLFDKCRSHPKINYHGAVDNAAIRQYAAQADILAYPSIWAETSCLVLIEAMSAGMICVHPNLAALYETAANWTMMYQYNEQINEHAKVFHLHLEKAINDIISCKSDTSKVPSRLSSQRSYANLFYDWRIRRQEWIDLLEQICEKPATNTIILGTSC